MRTADLRTDRLLLRRWRPEDLAPFAALNTDPEVMEHFVAPLTRAQSDALADRVEDGIAERGWGLWAVEVLDGEPGGFVGFCGLAPVPFEASFAPSVEVGWRLARAAWGQGYATEAARAALRVAFVEIGLDEVVSFTTRANRRSRAVMERLGMVRDPADDFAHPLVPAGHPIAPHVLYRIARPTRRG